MSRKLCLMTAVHGEPTPANVGGTGWTPDDSQFGARLALVRQKMGWNLKEAATECGVPPASWASWEAGSMPRQFADICDKVAQRTGADYLWLLAGSRRSGTRQDITSEYHTVAERRTEGIDLRRDNRPHSYPVEATTPGTGRTSYVSRNARRRRDR